MSKLSTFFENILSRLQQGFKKDYSTQQWLLLTHGKWKISVDNNEAFGTLSKAFVYLSHDLLIGKMHSYGLLLTFLRLLTDYLSVHK